LGQMAQEIHMRAARPVAAGAASVAVEEPGLYQAIGQLLGLGDPVQSEIDLARSVERGIPARAVEKMRRQLGLQDEEVHRLIAPRRTLSRRLATKAPLNAEESDHAVRVARVMVLARRVFGGKPEYAQTWLREPKKALDGRAPIEIIATGPGARAVEEMLIGIEHGMFA
jgi:putative toxin-antitoxin system antitoxin component (TIGR02293 family)